jgi:hypothetical protein
MKSEPPFENGFSYLLASDFDQTLSTAIAVRSGTDNSPQGVSGWGVSLSGEINLFAHDALTFQGTLVTASLAIRIQAA